MNGDVPVVDALGSTSPGGAAARGGRRAVEAMRQARGRVALRNYTLLLVLLVVFVVFQVLTKGIFLSQRNLGLLALQTVITGLAAISAVMLIVTRNFDVSIGSAVALVGVVLAILTVRLGVDPLVAVVLSLVVGLLMGAWNGFWVTVVGVPSFIVTLGGMLYFRGLSMIATNGATVSPVPPVLTNFATGYLPPMASMLVAAMAFAGYAAFQVWSARRARAFGLLSEVRPAVVRAILPALVGSVAAIYVASLQGIPYLVFVLALAVVAAEVVMRRSRFGAQLYAIGGNPEAARLSGIPVSRVIFFDFLVAGLAYGITGIALTARVSGAVAGSAGLFLELDAIAAAIIGGTSLAGGRGTILGALLGATLMGSLNNGMSLLNVPTFYQDTSRGIVLLVAVAIDQLGRRRG